MKIFDNFYVYLWRGQDNNCNACLLADVLKGGKHLLVDPGHVQTPSYREPGLERLTQEMRGDGLDYSSVGLIILTHGHPDHSEAAVSLQRETGALVAMHRADEEMFQMLGGRVDIYLQDGTLELADGEKSDLQIFHSPGHSPGHVTIYWPSRKVLIAGDCIFYRSTGRTDLPGGSSEELRNSIERLSRLDVEYLLCGHPYGHPGFIPGGDDVRENFELILSYL
jgi:glyoxylase-like metal-dependent hydrolase (beta-lactamase superfamily II)